MGPIPSSSSPLPAGVLRPPPSPPPGRARLLIPAGGGPGFEFPSSLNSEGGTRAPRRGGGQFCLAPWWGRGGPGGVAPWKKIESCVKEVCAASKLRPKVWAEAGINHRKKLKSSDRPTSDFGASDLRSADPPSSVREPIRLDLNFKEKESEARTSKPRTSKPRTSKPRTLTSKPRTSKPRTSKPRTSKPRTIILGVRQTPCRSLRGRLVRVAQRDRVSPIGHGPGLGNFPKRTPPCAVVQD